MALPALQIGATLISGLAGRGASKSQEALMRQQTKSLKRQREIGDETYDRYKDVFLPGENQLVDISQTMATPDYAGVLRRATGDYTRSRNQVRSESSRTYARMGIDPSNPMYTRGINRTNIADALALSTARNMAREAERNRTQDRGFNARMSVANIGRGMTGTALTAYNSAAAGFGQQAGIYGDQASSAYGAAGYFANQAFNSLTGGIPARGDRGPGSMPMEINWGAYGDPGASSANQYVDRSGYS